MMANNIIYIKTIDGFCGKVMAIYQLAWILTHTWYIMGMLMSLHWYVVGIFSGMYKQQSWDIHPILDEY
jgi:hypothetical protein